MLLAIILLAGAVFLVATRVRAEYPDLLTQVKHTTAQVQSWLAGPRSTCGRETCKSCPTTW